MYLKIIIWEARAGLISLRIEKKLAGCCVHGNELSVSVKCGEFIDQLSYF
jgi:hypothetical protein